MENKKEIIGYFITATIVASTLAAALVFQRFIANPIKSYQGVKDKWMY